VVRLRADLGERDAGAEKRRLPLRVAALIPTYNSGASLLEVVRNVSHHLPPPDILVVDDGSTDGSVDALGPEGATVIRHPENLGKGAALETGFREALARGYDAVITLDADGQHPPDCIPRFLEAADGEESGAGILLGKRSMSPDRMPLLRSLTNLWTSAIVSLLAGQWIPDSQSGYRLLRRRVLEGLTLDSRRYEAESEILIRASRRRHRIATVPIPTVYGTERSHIHPVRDTFRFLRMVGRSFRWR
jgi:glycosyltransferase involved in cell wall biosynthesis